MHIYRSLNRFESRIVQPVWRKCYSLLSGFRQPRDTLRTCSAPWLSTKHVLRQQQNAGFEVAPSRQVERLWHAEALPFHLLVEMPKTFHFETQRRLARFRTRQTQSGLAEWMIVAQTTLLAFSTFYVKPDTTKWPEIDLKILGAPPQEPQNACLYPSESKNKHPLCHTGNSICTSPFHLVLKHPKDLG